MPLAAGCRLGPYEIVSSIGAGGMGEVYRARDPRLGREVAIKVISENGAESPESLRWFEGEARAVAALNHPHILSLHDIGTEDGTAYVVFELLEGESLRARLDRGRLPPRKAVELAVQICAGLAAAHARGIIHRDLKPDNLFITKEGRAKILDFGLAKLTEPSSDGEGPTRTRTEAGTWKGTPGYVSPEQLRDGRADARSDLFALGATLYEMLTGRRAFRGPTLADTLSAILNSDPPPIEITGSPLPASLERVVRRCLEKDPEERFQSARDVGFALEAVAGSGSGEAGVIPSLVPPLRRWPRAIATLLALVAAVGGGLFAGRALLGRPIPSFKQLTFRRGMIFYARFAPDGRTVYYSAGWDGKPWEVFSTRTDSVESRPLGLPFSRVLSVSSAGQLAILTDPQRERWSFYSGTLAVIPPGGGAPRELVEAVQEADWTPDGRDLCILRRLEGESLMELPPGTVLYRSHRFLQLLRISPTGRHVAFVANTDTGPSIEVFDLASKQSRVLATSIPANVFGLAWAPGGNEVWFTAGHTPDRRDILAVDLSGRQRLVYRSTGVLALTDISADGRLLLHRGMDRQGVMVRGPDDRTERDLSVFNASSLGGLSRDGRTLLINETGGAAGPRGATYLRRVDGGDPVRLGEGEGFDLSPDGKSVLTLVGDPRQLTEVPVGPGHPRPIDLHGVTPSWNIRWVPPLGDRIAFVGRQAGRPERVWVTDHSGGTPRPITSESVANEFAVSPDGRKVALRSAPGTVAILPIDGGEAHNIHTLPEDFAVNRWSGDGRSLYLFNQANMPCEVRRLDLTTERVEPWRRVSPPDPAGIVHCRHVEPSEDGRTYAYSYNRALTDLILADGIR